MYIEALNILNKISSLGYEAYIVGGYPRDKYLGITSYDIDICTNAPFEILEKYFDIIKENKQFKSIIIKTNYEFEITNFRKDYYENSRYPKVEMVKTLREDLNRRDFTINTLCIDKDGNYVDLLNSKKDLDNKIVKMIDNPDRRIKEDPLRILRALRFNLNLKFNLDQDLEKAILDNKDLIKKLSTSLIEKEITKMLEKNKYEDILEIFNKYKLEVEICKKN